jgi:hypothetical protein
LEFDVKNKRLKDMTLEERREANIGAQVNNERLPAGAPLYYYCHSCGTETAVRPEAWFKQEDIPPRYCEECLKLPESERTDYNKWLRDKGHPRMAW